MNLKRSFPFHLLRWVTQFLENKEVKRKSESVSIRVKDEDLFYASPLEVEGAKGVVYSCITAGYDAPYEPIYKSDNLDYILYNPDVYSLKNLYQNT